VLKLKVIVRVTLPVIVAFGSNYLSLFGLAASKLFALMGIFCSSSRHVNVQGAGLNISI